MGLDRMADHVRRQNDVPQPAQRAVRRQRLGRETVERRARDHAAAKRVGERDLVHDRAARGVDQDRGVLHQRQLLRIDQPARAVVQVCQHDHHVTGAQQGFQINPRHGRQAGQIGLAARAVLQIRAPGRQQPRGLAPDLAEPDEADGLAAKLAGLELRRTPQMLPDPVLRALEVVERGEHHQHRRLGHADDVFLGLRVGNHHGVLGGRRQIDAVDAGHGGDDGAQPRRRRQHRAVQRKHRDTQQEIDAGQRIGGGRERGAIGVAHDPVPGPAQVGADLVEHLVVGMPANDGDIERSLRSWHGRLHVSARRATRSPPVV